MPNIFTRIITAINRISDVFATGSFERIRAISEMNSGFMEAYKSGDLQFYCHVTTGMGISKFRHRLSYPVIRSGWKITIENDKELTAGEIKEYGKVIVESKSFVRNLMVMGYDTLLLVP